MVALKRRWDKEFTAIKTQWDKGSFSKASRIDIMENDSTTKKKQACGVDDQETELLGVKKDLTTVITAPTTITRPSRRNRGNGLSARSNTFQEFHLTPM